MARRRTWQVGMRSAMLRENSFFCLFGLPLACPVELRDAHPRHALRSLCVTTAPCCERLQERSPGAQAQ